MNDEQQGPTSVVLLQGGTYVTEVSVKTEMGTLLWNAICKIRESKYSYNYTEVDMSYMRILSNGAHKCQNVREYLT